VCSSDLGVDSLGAVAIALDIEDRTGFRCTVDIIYDNQSVNALAKYLETYATPAEKGENKAMNTNVSWILS
jgi:acyl carrier protein